MISFRTAILSTMILAFSCQSYKETKKKPIKDVVQVIPLYLRGGIMPIKLEQSDSLFCETYSVNYIDSGCVTSEEFVKKNIASFKVLDENYGDKWTQTVRRDVMAIDQRVKEFPNSNKKSNNPDR